MIEAIDPKQFIESDLFGYAKGAFTGAATKGQTSVTNLPRQLSKIRPTLRLIRVWLLILCYGCYSGMVYQFLPASICLSKLDGISRFNTAAERRNITVIRPCSSNLDRSNSIIFIYDHAF
jgi:hypothetical protein